MSSQLEIELTGKKYKSSNVFSKVLDDPDKTLEDILNDDDFLSEVTIQNENLFYYLSNDKISEMVDLLLEEPGIANTSIKSFKTPFIICETFGKDIDYFTDALLNPDNNYGLFSKLLSYFTQDKENLDMGVLNQTLSGYVSKIITFGCLRRPIAVLACLEYNLETLAKYDKHLYLGECISDIISKFISLAVYDSEPYIKSLELIQNEIMKFLVQNIEKSLDIFIGIIKKGYCIVNAKSFFSQWFESEAFESMMGTSLCENLIKIALTCDNSANKKLATKAIDVLELMVNNLFVKTPLESEQDLEEIQFGFKVESIAGISMEELKQDDTNMDVDQEESKGSDAKTKAPSKKNDDSGEGKLLERNQKEIKEILETKQNIFTSSEGRIKVITGFLKFYDDLASVFEYYSSEEANPKTLKYHRRQISMGIGGTRTLLPTKFKNEPVDRILIAKLINLFSVLVTLNSEDFLKQIYDTNILKGIVTICELYDDHTMIQAKMRCLFESILKLEDINMKTKLLNESRCVFLFAKQLNQKDQLKSMMYQSSNSQRNTLDVQSPGSRDKNKAAAKPIDYGLGTKPIYTTIRYIADIIRSQMDIQMEALLEDMQVNWSIVESTLHKEKQEIEAEVQDYTVKGSFEKPEHIDNDKINKHYLKQSSDVSENLAKTALNTRKKLAGLDGFI